MADVQGGVGPFLAIYLQASRHWDAASVGVALSITSIAAPLAQMPAGAFVDQSHNKRALIAVASLLIGLSSAYVVFTPSKLGIYMTQCVIGVASAIFIPVIAAISLGIVGTARLDRRIARNESLNHAGNVITVLGAVGLGAAISNILAREIASKAGYLFAFLFLSAIATIAIVIFWCFMPETLLDKEKLKEKSKEKSKQQ